jgi:hypothetical protein
LLETLDQLVTARGGGYTDAYNLLARAEHTLLKGLSRRTLTDEERGLVEVGYGDALSRGFTAAQERAVRAQLHFYRWAALAALPTAPARALAEGLDKIEQAVLPSRA